MTINQAAIAHEKACQRLEKAQLVGGFTLEKAQEAKTQAFETLKAALKKKRPPNR